MRQVLQTTQLLEFGIQLNNMLQALQEPIINFRQFMNALHAISFIHRLCDSKNTLVCRCFESRIQIIHTQILILRKTMHALADHTQAFLHGIFECTADSHHFAYRLHGTAEFTIHAAELTQIPTRDLTYHVIQCRFKERRSGLRHRVFQFKQAISKA